MVSLEWWARAMEVTILGEKPARCCWREISVMTVSVPPHSWETKRRGTWMMVELMRGDTFAEGCRAATPAGEGI